MFKKLSTVLLGILGGLLLLVIGFNSKAQSPDQINIRKATINQLPEINHYITKEGAEVIVYLAPDGGELHELTSLPHVAVEQTPEPPQNTANITYTNSLTPSVYIPVVLNDYPLAYVSRMWGLRHSEPSGYIYPIWRFQIDLVEGELSGNTLVHEQLVCDGVDMDPLNPLGYLWDGEGFFWWDGTGWENCTLTVSDYYGTWDVETTFEVPDVYEYSSWPELPRDPWGDGWIVQEGIPTYNVTMRDQQAQQVQFSENVVETYAGWGYQTQGPNTSFFSGQAVFPFYAYTVEDNIIYNSVRLDGDGTFEMEVYHSWYIEFPAYATATPVPIPN
jgi:hypothetical protein